MKTLILSNSNLHSQDYGSARRIWNLALNKAQNGEKIIIIHNALNGPNKRTKKHIEGITVTQVPLPLKIMRKKHFFFQNNPYMILELIRNRDADQIQFESPYLLPTAIFAIVIKKKLVYDAHGIEVKWQKELYNRNWLWLKIIKLIEYFSLKFADKVICCSETDAKNLNRMYSVPRRKIEIIENSVDLEMAKKTKPYRFKKKTVLFIGSQLHPANKEAIEKIYYEIIPKVLEKRSDVQFCFIGENPPKYLKGKNILVIPEVHDKKIFPYIKGADLCIAPVLKGAARTSIREYLACEKIVITTPKQIEGLNIKGKKVIIKKGINNFPKDIIKNIGKNDK